MQRRRYCFPLVLGLALFASPVLNVGAALRFFAMGDAPYSEGEFLQLEGLLADVTEARPPFVIHVGDIKSGNSVCTDTYAARVAALFRSLPVPVAYTPGDNEWTDCWRAGGAPMERLAALRQILYGDPTVLRLAELSAVQPDPGYPENYYFMTGGVAFAAIHAVGSGNGLRSKDEGALKEWRARSAANRTLLEKAVAAANAAGAGALVVFFQADPLFGRPDETQGFEPIFRDLRWLLHAFAGPILVIHGDGHRYVVDQPLADPQSGQTEPRLTRLEVPGSPLVEGVWVTYDSAAGQQFHFELADPAAFPDADLP